MIYYLIILGVIITYPFCNKIIKNKKERIDGALVYIIFWTIILILLCGLRRIDVGRDTMMYSIAYSKMQSRISWKDALDRYSYIEFGFYFLEFLVSRYFNYQVFLIICAIISILPVMIVIHRYSENKMISLVLYISFPYYTFSMSGIRQACALGIIMLAYIAVREKKLPMFLIFTFMACLFHTSAVLFLPTYWLDKIPYKKRTIYLSIVFLLTTFIFRGFLWNIASQFARQSYSANDAGGRLMYLFMILTIILGFYYRKNFVGENEEHKVLLYMQVISAAIWPIASVNSAIARMYYYHHIFLILYVPTLIKSIKRRFERLIISFGYLFVAIYFISTQVLPATFKFSPYFFFWQ